ncbi:phosphoribosyl-ATP diphosphatase [Hydrocarboniphaga sp.]|uniref:phosphoribosyl-ATP diphosphatase n=1 Tax=Hydrocarboniphaga sp. TaxID=2033016 RepID=UPI003D106BE9
MATTPDLSAVLDDLYALLQQRKGADPSTSYAASLYAKGTDTILKKLGEEAVETVIAAKNEDPKALVYELADLWYHTLVLMAQRNIAPQQIAAELARRSAQSGLAEKASRGGH